MAARYDWETIRAEYEAGATMGELSRKHGVSKQAISKRARAEGWIQDSSEAVARLTAAKVDGLVDGVNPKKKAEAVNQAADRKAAVIREQREAWDGFKTEVKTALAENNFERLKCLKIASESLRNAQECERKAWGITDLPADAPPPVASQPVTVNIDFSAMTTEQLNELGIAMMPKEKA